MFVVNIDDMFVGSLPADIKENAKIMNEQKALALDKDFNTLSLILSRMKNIIALKMNPCKSEEKKAEAKRLEKFPGFFYECANILITIWYTMIVNF